MSVRSALYVLALILAGALLFIFLVFGAIFALVYRNRRPSFSYFASGMTTSVLKVALLGSVGFENAARRTPDLAGPQRGGPAARHAWPRRELQRRDFTAGGCER